MKTNNDRENNSRVPLSEGKHPILVNVFLIVALAILGILIVYFSLALFTKHGQKATVPSVENLSFSDAVEKLHNAGFRVEIRDSLYRDDLRPGIVIDQFPVSGAVAKPGRKIFITINALHPKQVMIDEEDRPGLNAMRGMTYRSALSHLQELGFKNIRLVRVLGDSQDIVARVIANGRPVKKRQLIPVNSQIVIEIFDGRLSLLYDSLYNIEMSLDPSFREHSESQPLDPYYVPGQGNNGTWTNTETEEEEESGTYHYTPEENSNQSEPEEETETIGL